MYNNSASYSNALLVEYDTSGTPIWADRSSISPAAMNYAMAYSVAADTSGNVYITGGTWTDATLPNLISFGSLQLSLPALLDQMYLVKFDSLGNPLWGKVLAGGGDDGNNVAVDRFGDIFVGGELYGSPIVIGSDTLVSSFNSESPFVAKIGMPVRINEFPTPQSTITISPNPFTSQTTTTFNEPQKNTTIKIMDVIGKEIKTINFTGKECVIEKGEMKAGVYFVEISPTVGRGATYKKLVVQ